MSLIIGFFGLQNIDSPMSETNELSSHIAQPYYLILSFCVQINMGFQYLLERKESEIKFESLIDSSILFRVYSM